MMTQSLGERARVKVNARVGSIGLLSSDRRVL